uniref:GNAT family N-acetyltransferase n=1 Tax=Phocaeicola dorei TaxID=357276 RepID=UPI003FF0D8F5
MKIRRYEPRDLEQITHLFYETVHTINAKDYTDEQLNVWATGSVDLAAWDASLQSHLTYVMTEGNLIVGFGDIDDTGYLDRLFVHKDYQRQRIGSILCDKLESVVETDTITVHASITAKPFFEKRGYKLVKQQEVKRQGILLTNYILQKDI